MQRDLATVLFRTALTFLLAFLLLPSAQAQILGIPAAQKDSQTWDATLSLLPQDQPLACWVWNQAGELNPNGNPSEKWFANDDLQKSFGKLKQAIATLAQENAPPSVAMLAQDVGWKMLSKAGSLVIESVDMDEKSVFGSIIVNLGEDEEQIRGWLDKAMAETGVESEMMGPDKTYRLPDVPFPVFVGIHGGHLICTSGDGQWKTMTDRIDQENKQPQWLAEYLKQLPIERRSQFAFGDIAGMMKLLPPEANEDPTYQRIKKVLALQGIKSFSASSGTDSVSNVSMFNFQCDKQGLTSVFDVPPIDKSKLKEIPANAIAGFAFRCSLEKVMQLVKGSVPEADMEEAMARFNIETGLDLESDIVEHLDGTVRYYNAGSVIAPKQIGILKIKDEAKFEKSLKQINERVEEMAAEQGFEFTESEKKGLRVYGIKNPPASFYWAVKDGELYISSSARTIGSHIRKAAKGEQATLLDSELASKILSQADTLGLKGPIAMNHYDFDPVFEAAVPAIAGLYAFLPPETTEAFDFTPEDLPPVEALLGMRPTKSMIFQASNGYTGIFRYDAPAPLELSTVAVSGVAIGMLLPAVQAVREAARRTQSMNNQRQLVLALLNYEAAHGRFPPAYTTDADGKPLLSWRVAILPYLDENDLFEEFHQDEPWDSEHNIALLEKMPPFFKNPSSLGDRLGYTDYVAPVNKDSVLASGKGIRIAQITDGTSNTVMLMEVGGDQQVPWSSPQDIKVEDLKTLQLPNGHPGTVTVAFVDGSVHSISKLVPVEDFWKSCRKSDGVGAELILNY